MSRSIARLLVQWSLVSASLGLAPAALAEDPAFSDLPPYLLERMGRGGTLDDFVQNLTKEALRSDLDGNGLDRQDLEIAAQMEAATYRASAMTQILMYDLDGNGEVTKDEVTRAATYQMNSRRSGEGNTDAMQKQIDKSIERAMVLDENGDGILTIAEGLKAAPPDKNLSRKAARFESLLALDPDKDGRLTAAELEQVARQAFAAVDYDHDGTLSSSEIKLLSSARQFQQKMLQAMPCDLPKPAAEDMVAALGTYGGTLQPTVTVAGQDQTTQLTLLDIEPGAQPLYLVLTSYNPMIWQFQGATERVARVAAIRYRKTEKEPEMAGAGIIGLPADKVAFLPPQSCGNYYYKADSDEAAVMASVIEKVTGQAADAVLGVYSAKMIALPSGTASDKVGDKDLIVAPGGGSDLVILGQNTGVKVVQGQSWANGSSHEDWMADRANVVAFDPAQVVAPGKVEAYEVLPNQYGLRQLVEEGKLERTDRGYRIVQPIPRFPAGLTGAHGVTFLLPEGTPMPAGDAGHSQIILEKKP